MYGCGDWAETGVGKNEVFLDNDVELPPVDTLFPEKGEEFRLGNQLLASVTKPGEDWILLRCRSTVVGETSCLVCEEEGMMEPSAPLITSPAPLMLAIDRGKFIVRPLDCSNPPLPHSLCVVFLLSRLVISRAICGGGGVGKSIGGVTETL